MSDVKFVPADAYNGSPVVPTGNPMIDGVGPASWNPNRRDEPDVTFDGRPKLVAMRADAAFSIAKGDPDPRGLPVVAADKVVAGTVVDVWVNRSEPQVAYYEVQLSASGRRVLLPSGYVQWPNFGLWGNDKLLVKAITAAQFADVPATAREDRITLLEEDRICAYYAGGHLYSTPSRSQPLI